MARTYVVTSAPNAAELVESFDLAVAALLSHRLTRLDLLATNEPRRNGTEYRAVLTYDTGATVLTTPFQLAVFEGRSPAEAQSKLAAFAAANPTYFISEAIGVVFGGQQRTVGDALAVVYNASAGAGDNWGAGGAGGGPINENVVVTATAGAIPATQNITIYTGTGGTFTLPAANILGAGNACVLEVKHAGTGTLLVARAGADTVEGDTQAEVPLGGALTFASDGVSAWYII